MQSADGNFYSTKGAFLQGAKATSNTPQDFSALSAKEKIVSPKGIFWKAKGPLLLRNRTFRHFAHGENYVYQMDSALCAIENFPEKSQFPVRYHSLTLLIFKVQTLLISHSQILLKNTGKPKKVICIGGQAVFSKAPTSG